MRSPTLQNAIIRELKKGEKTGDDLRRSFGLFAPPYGALSVMVRKGTVQKVRRDVGDRAVNFYRLSQVSS